jgi:hypothetical protein
MGLCMRFLTAAVLVAGMGIAPIRACPAPE